MKSIKPTGKRKIVSLDEAVRRVEGYQKPVEPIPAPSDTEPMPFRGQLYERDVPAVMMPYDESLKRIKKAGFERHIRPREYFRYLMAFWEGDLSPEEENFARELLLDERSVWLSMAFRKEGDQLICYQDPVNICEVDTADTFSPSLFSIKESKIIDIDFVKPGNNVDLHLLEDDLTVNDFCEWFFGRRFEDWPDPLKNMRPYAYIPPTDELHAVSYEYQSKKKRIHLRWSLLAQSRGIKGNGW